MTDTEQPKLGNMGLEESQITEDDYKFAYDMDDYPPEGDIVLKLFTQETEGPENGQGRTSSVGEEDSTIMDEQKTNYRLCIQRPLWVDGKYHYRNRENKDETKEATLVVLKFYVRSLARDNGKPISKLSAQLDFGTKDDNGPEVVGWAPFYHMKQHNTTSADQTQGWSSTTSAQAGWNGSSFQQTMARNGSQSWQKTYFDQYSSSGVSVGRRQCGVRWDMTHNSLENHGVLPEFRVYVLLTRSSNQKYLVKFTMDVTAGHIGSITETLHLTKCKEKKSVFFVTPNTTRPFICFGDGETILNKIQLEHLELLKSNKLGTSLKLPWEEEEGEEVQKVEDATTRGAQEAQDAQDAQEAQEAQKDKAEPGRDSGKLKHGAAARKGGQQEEGPKSAETAEKQGSWKERSPIIQSEGCNLAADLVADYSRPRLLMLETRMAQLEYRLALQDMTITQLRQEQNRAPMQH